MNPQKYTQKSLEAIQEAQNIAVRNQNQSVDEEHLLDALLTQENGLIPQLLLKMGIEPKLALNAVEGAINSIPKVTVSGRQAGTVYISNDLDKALAEAEVQADRMKDSFVSVEHIILGIFENPNSKHSAQVRI